MLPATSVANIEAASEEGVTAMLALRADPQSTMSTATATDGAPTAAGTGCHDIEDENENHAQFSDLATFENFLPERLMHKLMGHDSWFDSFCDDGHVTPLTAAARSQFMSCLSLIVFPFSRTWRLR